MACAYCLGYHVPEALWRCVRPGCRSDLPQIPVGYTRGSYFHTLSLWHSPNTLIEIFNLSASSECTDFSHGPIIRDHRVCIYKYPSMLFRKNKARYDSSLISQSIRRVCACGFEGLGGDGCEYDEEHGYDCRVRMRQYPIRCDRRRFVTIDWLRNRRLGMR